jgi:3-oxoadipate enol-lactonase
MPFDHGSGPPVVIVPGLNGRWEWMRPALENLSQSCRAISYSLSGDFGSGVPMDADPTFDDYVDQLESVLDAAGVERAAICGVSFGGVIALRFAATRRARTSALIIASSPAPGWTPTMQQARGLSRPWLSAPAFVANAPARLFPEIRAAVSTWPQRIGFVAAQTARVIAAPIIPPLMASRIHGMQQLDFKADCASVQAPTLIVTGEEGLDKVVPVGVTRTYAALIRGARYEVMKGTGHIGVLTRPAAFADIVGGFAHAHDH